MYFEKTSQLIFMLIKCLKEKKSRSDLSGLLLENINMRIFYMNDRGNNYCILFLCLIYQFQKPLLIMSVILGTKLSPGETTGLCDIGIGLCRFKFLYTSGFLIKFVFKV